MTASDSTRHSTRGILPWVALAASALLITSLAHPATGAHAAEPAAPVEPPAPGKIVSVEPQADGSEITSVQVINEPVAAPSTLSDQGQTYDQESETTIYYKSPEEVQDDQETDGAIRPLDDQSSGANDGTQSVNVWVNLNYSVRQPSVLVANRWESRYTRLDGQAVLVEGGVEHRNDRVPTSATQTYSSPTSGQLYSFNPSYAGFETESSSLNGIFGQAYLIFQRGGTSYEAWSGTVHPF